MPEVSDTSVETTVGELVSRGPPFKPVDTISLDTTSDELLRQIQCHQREGIPFVISGLNTHAGWPHQEKLGGGEACLKEGKGRIRQQCL